MNPPIKIDVKTDNLQKCTLSISGADAKPEEVVTIEVPADGNVYQGLHRARESLELVMNDILAFHGILPPPPPSERPDPDAIRAAKVAELAAEVAKLDAKKAELDRYDQLRADHAALEKEIAERTAAAVAEEALPDAAVTPDAPPADK